jgi:uncharacterized protein (TIGR02646 family)
VPEDISIMLKLEKNITYTLTETKMLSLLDLSKGKAWDSQTNEMKRLKKRLRKRLDILQNGCCAYCGNSLYVTSALEIEHIAPKGKDLYPEFTFHNKNLVGACSYCNGCYKKHATDVVSTRDTDYEKCTFLLVHPYLDNPEDHIKWQDDPKLIINNALSSAKGKYSIKMFELDRLEQTVNRAKDYDMRKKLEGTPFEGKRLTEEDIAHIIPLLISEKVKQEM